MHRLVMLAIVLLAASAWIALGRPAADAPSRLESLRGSESSTQVRLPVPTAAQGSTAPIVEPSPQAMEQELLAGDLAQVLEWAASPSVGRVDAALQEFRTATSPRKRAIALYLLARSRRHVAHAERDAVLSSEAVPFLRDVTLAPATDATRPAILALSALADPEAARVLALAARDPREPVKAGEALSALIVRPDRYSVGALEDMARARASGAARLRAVRALLTAAAVWGPEPDDLDARAALLEARRFLEMEGRSIADSIARSTRIPDVQGEARALVADIESLFHPMNE